MQKLFLLTLTILLLSGCYEQYASYQATKLPLDGKYLKIANKNMHIVEKGEGVPSVIFISGWDIMGHMSWQNVQNEVAQKTYTLSYDRAGILRSDTIDSPRTCSNIAKELHILLENANVKKPYILVGHSLGGGFIRCFVKQHKNEVAGVVLVDSAHPEQMKYYKKSVQERMRNLPSLWLVKLQAYSGLARIYSKIYGHDIPFIKKDDIRNSKKNAFLPKSYIEYIREGKHFKEMSQEVNGTTFGDTPLIVLSAKESQKTQAIMYEDWKMLQDKLAKLSSNSKHRWVDSGHYIQLEKPKVVIEAVNEMVDMVRED